jgi:hypothetical protein
VRRIIVVAALSLSLALSLGACVRPATFVPPSTLKGHVYKCLDSTGHIYTTDSPWGQTCVRVG